MLIGLHGASALKVLAILAANYWIGKTTAGTAVGPVVNWAFNLGILIVNELADGYKFAALHPSLGYLVRILMLSTNCVGLIQIMDRIHGRGSIPVGTSRSTLRCSVSCHSIWIIIGHVLGKRPRMPAKMCAIH